MFNHLPEESDVILAWSWADFEPYYQDLNSRSLSDANLGQWLADWTALHEHGEEMHNRLMVAVSSNTADEAMEHRYIAFYDDIYPKAMEAEQALKQKLLESGLQPAGFEIPLKGIRAEVDLFRPENLPLVAEQTRLTTEYDKITGAQTVEWKGQEQTIEQMNLLYQETDRSTREQAWRMVAERQLADREVINQLWGKLLRLRLQMAANAGRPDYRAYRWQELKRFDYTPDDAHRFRQAIEEAVVPAASRIYQRRKEQLGVDTLRPWDLDVDPLSRRPLRPFTTVDELISGTAAVFDRVDEALGGHYKRMVSENLLDLDNRKNKAPGGYCTEYPVGRVPFIFMNAVGTHDNLQTLLHEGGHAFHVLESADLPYYQQREVPMEFAEVASMSMELLAAPYLAREQGGFYSPAEAARARVEHLHGIILFWPYMAVVDGFQHWVYENPQAAQDPANCDACWSDLWRRFMPGVDWSGFEDVMATGWHRKLHIHTDPFYYIEYGLAQLGAVQVWANSLSDQAGAVARYREALSRGGTLSLPQLFQTAGAQFALDVPALRRAVSLAEETIERLQAEQ